MTVYKNEQIVVFGTTKLSVGQKAMRLLSCTDSKAKASYNLYNDTQDPPSSSSPCCYWSAG